MVAIIITGITMLTVTDLARIGMPMVVMAIASGQHQRRAVARPQAAAAGCRRRTLARLLEPPLAP